MSITWPRGAYSPTQLAEARRCPRAHKLKYRDGWVPKASLQEDPNLLFGRCGHKVLEILGKKALHAYATDPEEWELAVNIGRQDLLNSADPALASKLTVLMAAYRVAFGAENAGYGDLEVEEVETVLSGGDLLDEGRLFACIADGVLRDRSGKRVVCEHKFLGKKFYGKNGDEADIVRKLKLDDQVCALAYCSRERWGEIPRVLYNVLLKTSKPAFQRIWLDLTDAELDSWRDDTRQAQQFFALDCPNRTACHPKGGGFTCAYLDFCHPQEGTVRDDLYEIRKRPVPHE